jgi:type II secretory pathway pseudopilin PulG
VKKERKWLRNSGYALLTAIIAVNIFAILLLKARTMWETTLQRDLEEELIFRGRQYVTAIDMYKKKNAGVNPKSLDELFEKNFLRKRFTDPMTEEGTWNLVMQDGKAGKKGLLIVPEEMIEQYIGRAMIVGVCSTSPDEGFREYRKKKRYSEWAIYLGGQEDKDMPELKYVAEGEGQSVTPSTTPDSGRDDGRNDGRNDGRGR